MEERITRFKHCDSRFHPYLEKVLERLPEDIKVDVLNNEGFQFVAGDEFHDMCVLHYAFDHPVEKIVYLNTRMLIEPEYRIILGISHGVAHYVVGEKKATEQEKNVENLLIHWGFEKELEAVRYCHAIAESEDYKVGYEWAKKQSGDYLSQHFGLYFDEWDEKGLGTMSRNGFEQIYDHPEIPSILAKMSPLRKATRIESEKDKISEAFTKDEAVVAGIMAAIKEIRSQDLYGPKNCTS